MKRLYYGIEDKDGNVPGNVFEEGEMISSVLVPSESLSEREKPGELEIKKNMDHDPLEEASEIDPSEYLVKRWEDGKAKRIYSGMIGSVEDNWKDVESVEVYGNGEIFVDEEKIKGDFTITHGSTVLIKDVQDVAERTDQEIEKEFFHCIRCGKEMRSYRAIEEALPDDWTVETDEESHLERKDDGSVVIKGICPGCAEEKDQDDI